MLIHSFIQYSFLPSDFSIIRLQLLNPPYDLNYTKCPRGSYIPTLAVSRRQPGLARLREVMQSTLRISSMVSLILIGFVLDFIEITFVVVHFVGPVLLAMGLDPVWLGIMIAINLQTSFLTPPFGFALFYLRGVAPASVTKAQIYRGVIPFVGIQLLALLLLAIFPGLVTWLPEKIYGQ